MAFTEITLTGTVEVTPGDPALQTVVELLLSEPITDGVIDLIPRTLFGRAASDGTWSIVAPANDDETSTPAGSFYHVNVVTDGVTVDSWSVVVPHDATPVDLMALPRLPS